MAQRENKVEAYLKKRMEAIGGAAEKHVNPGARGDPDRLCSFPNGYHCLVETKWSAYVQPEPHQRRRHAWWRQRGMPVYTLGSPDEVDAFMSTIGIRHDR